MCVRESVCIYILCMCVQERLYVRMQNMRVSVCVFYADEKVCTRMHIHSLSVRLCVIVCDCACVCVCVALLYI